LSIIFPFSISPVFTLEKPLKLKGKLKIIVILIWRHSWSIGPGYQFQGKSKQDYLIWRRSGALGESEVVYMCRRPKMTREALPFCKCRLKILQSKNKKIDPIKPTNQIKNSKHTRIFSSQINEYI
jgi:hypothetical protein